MLSYGVNYEKRFRVMWEQLEKGVHGRGLPWLVMLCTQDGHLQHVQLADTPPSKALVLMGLRECADYLQKEIARMEKEGV